MSTVDIAARGHRQSPLIAAVLSFLWPGLGHWYVGRTKAAALFGLPVLGIALILGLQAIAGIEQLAALLITPSSALTVVILVWLLAVWRLIAIADAVGGFRIKQPWLRPSLASTFVALALGVLVIHGAVGYVAWKFYENGSQIFVGDNGPDASQRPTLAPGETPDPSDEYFATPIATPATRDSRINILLTGVDSGPTRTHSLTDTLIIASIDPVTKDVALISFPRDIAQFELWDGRTFRGKINSLMSYARQHPDEFPDGPLPSLVRELGYLIGAPIHYYAAVDLEGFRRMIDIVGGITIENPRRIADARYDWLDGRPLGFFLPAGTHTLNGEQALAYVRSRQGAGDNDFTRARRQQQILVALRGKLTSPDILVKLPDILDAAGDTIKTNFPSDRVAEMLDLARDVDPANLVQAVLGPPYSVHPPTNTTGGVYILRIDLEKVAELSIKVFGEGSRYYTDAQAAP